METVSNQDTPNVPTTILSYTYDNVGNVLSMTDSINGNLGVTTSHQFDALNRMTQNTQGNKRVDYVYNALSQVTSKKRYSDTTGTNLVAETSHTFDNLNRLTDISHSKGANVLANYSQAYDAKSRITGVTGTDGSSSFTYDNTDQLTGVDYSFQTDESYTYDDNGNRTNAGYVTGVNNRLLEDNKFRYEYDLVGNRTKRTDKLTAEVTNYSWDVRDRLTGLVVRNVLGEEVRSAGYTYDVYNQRIAKTVDMDGAGVQAATTERYVYGGDQNIDLIFDENGNVSHRYLFGAGVDQIEADESGGSVLWALTDHLGSVRDVVDNAGVVQNHVVYDAFGGVTSQTNASVVFRYGYTARELDAESGLQYNRARYLDSFNGRFISEDPIGFQGQDANLYRYVGNNSLSFTDPSGEGPENLIFLDTIIQKNRDEMTGITLPRSEAGRFSGKDPWQPRDKKYAEEQRLYTINLVKQQSSFICEQAKKYRVTPDAIAGAILWEGIENPYRESDIWFGQSKIPGKIHAFQKSALDPFKGKFWLFPGEPTEMQKVEEEKRVPWNTFGGGGADFMRNFDRKPHLENPSNAIIAIAAILDRSASIYEALPLSQSLINGINIRNQAGVLTALYQGGDPEGRSERFLNRVYKENGLQAGVLTGLYLGGNSEGKTAGAITGLYQTGRSADFAVYPQIPSIKEDKEAMGAWVSQYRTWIHREFFSNCKPC
jgi:RHS repeat-associated protein